MTEFTCTKKDVCANWRNEVSHTESNAIINMLSGYCEIAGRNMPTFATEGRCVLRILYPEVFQNPDITHSVNTIISAAQPVESEKF